jgi:hypothetical protein
MLGSITPLGERGRGQRYWLTAGALGVGAAAAGAALGVALGGLGALAPGLTPGVSAAVLAGLLAVGVLLDAGTAGLRLPGPRRQVSEEWLGRYRGWVVGLGFGAQLGVGVATVVPLAATYAMLAAAFLTGSPRAGLAIGVAFGLVRWLATLPGARVQRPSDLARLARGLARLDARSRRLALGAEAALVVALVGVALA